MTKYYVSYSMIITEPIPLCVTSAFFVEKKEPMTKKMIEELEKDAQRDAYEYDPRIRLALHKFKFKILGITKLEE